MTLGENIKSNRLRLKLSQNYVAEKLDVSRQAVSKWETNQSEPTAKNLVELSSLFGITLSELVEPEKVVDNEQDIKYSFNIKKSFEYKSKIYIYGKPFIHIAKNAKGIIAIGLTARGIISIGLFSIGVLSIGLFTFGLIALGTLSLGFVSGGAFSVGILSFGAICLGVISIGALAIGEFSVGALAIGHYFALGDNARAMIAIGSTEAYGSIYQTISELTNKDIDIIKNLLSENIPLYLKWAKNIVYLFL